MKLSTKWIVRWAVALGLAGALAFVPLRWAMEDHDEGAVPPEGVEMAKLDYTVKDMNGLDVRLSDFKGRPMIINFWATWCGPCKHEIPLFNQLVEKYKAQNFIVLGISVDDKPEDLRPFAAEFKMNYPVLVGLGHDELQEHYGANPLPISWFIRADGSVDYKLTGTQSLDWFEGRVKRLFEPRTAEGQ